MVDKKTDALLTGKIFGILSIVFAFISSWGLGGIILGIIGLSQVKGESKTSSRKVRNLNVLGIVFGGILFIISLVSMIVMVSQGIVDLAQFPTQ